MGSATAFNDLIDAVCCVLMFEISRIFTFLQGVSESVAFNFVGTGRKQKMIDSTNIFADESVTIDDTETKSSAPRGIQPGVEHKDCTRSIQILYTAMWPILI
jgi:hypothetical protein